MLPIMYSISRAGKSTDLRLIEANRLLEETRLLVKDLARTVKPKTYNFDKGEAWKWQIGIAVKILIIVCCFLVILWSGYFWWLSKYDLKKANRIISVAPFVEKNFLLRVKQDKEGYYFIEFQEAKTNSVKYFTEYEKLKEGKVRVYVGKE